MKPHYLRLFTPWWLTLIALLLMSCGSDNNPASPSATTANQVTALNSNVPDNLFTATLTGSDEVPANNSTATGTSVVMVDPASLVMKASITTADISATAAHIHLGAAGFAGPIVFPLTETTAGSGIWITTVTLSQDQFSVLQVGSFYVNVHSSAFPDGEIRGQLLAQIPASGQTVSSIGASATTTTATASTTTSANRPVFYINQLSGSLVVPANTSSATAVGLSVFRPLDKSLTSVVISNGITGTDAAIRQAAAGTNGPLVSNMSESVAGSGIWTAKATLTDTQIQALQADLMYHEILSAEFPAGELRGQIVKSKSAKKTATVATPASTAAGATTGTTTSTPAATSAPTTITTSTPSSSTATTLTPATTVTPASTLSGTGLPVTTTTTTGSTMRKP